jgi:uncharacterized Zn finger protein (UPF0148 family)
MTRNLTIGDTTCGECGQWYETVEEAAECEYLDILDAGEAARAAERDEYWETAQMINEDEIREAEAAALDEQEHWEADDAYLRSLHSFEFAPV